jgi:hypothetical protein
MRAILFAFSLLVATAHADTPVVLPDHELFAKDAKEFLIESTIPGDFKTPEGVVAALLTLGDQVANRKLSASFQPKSLSSTSQFEGALPLASYYRGARLDGKTFTISFSAEAMRYLDNTVAIQQLVKGAIEGTVKRNFPAVDTIQYQIDGKIVTDWDG